MAIKDKIINCISINLAKKYGDQNKSDEFLIEAEYIFKDLLLRVLIEKANGGDPLKYVECLENFEEICDWDFYDTFFVESMIFGE